MHLPYPRYTKMHHLFTQYFSPTYIDLIDETHMHQVPKHSESHFKLILVSTKFVDHSRVQRHRMVEELITAERENGLHAFSMQLFTPEEWHKNPKINPSPPCERAKK